jgi:hypothetical protein
MTSEYTFVTPKQQNELSRRMQEKLTAAKVDSGSKLHGEERAPSASETPSSFADAEPATSVVQ